MKDIYFWNKCVKLPNLKSLAQKVMVFINKVITSIIQWKSLRIFWIILAGLLSIPFTFFVILITNKPLNFYFDISINKILESRGAWTLIVLIFSAPVALAIWHFRDKNAIEQIENQRKDVNLKEFQKIAEWATDVDFFNKEEKNKIDENKDVKTDKNIHNLPVRQISAIYSLLPFYRGDYGASFKNPAFYILNSLWQMKHQRNLQKLDDCKNNEERDEIIRAIKEDSYNIFSVAVLQVMLTDSGKYILQHSEEFSLFGFSGINLHLPGLNESIREQLFCNLKKASGIQLQAAILRETSFKNSNLSKSNFQYADITKSKFYNSNLERANLSNSDIKESVFRNTSLKSSIFNDAYAQGTIFEDLNATDAKFINSNLSHTIFRNLSLLLSNLSNTNLIGSSFEEVNFSHANLQGADFSNSNFVKITMTGANLINIKGIKLDEIHKAIDKKGLIIDFRENFSNADIERLKSDGVIFIIGEKTLSTSNNNTDKLRVDVSFKQEPSKFTYFIHGFKIDFQKTEAMNPDWHFTLHDTILNLETIIS